MKRITFNSKFFFVNASRCQFHQHSKSSFYADILGPKSTHLKCKYKKLSAKLVNKKAGRKMLVKLTTILIISVCVIYLLSLAEIATN